VIAYFQQLEQQRAALDGELAVSIQARLTCGTRGRPRAIPLAAKELLEMAGYRVYGSRIADPPGAWRDPAAMATRFFLLAPEWQDLLGSSEALAGLLRRSWARLKGANRRQRPCTLNQALADELACLVEARGNDDDA